MSTRRECRNVVNIDTHCQCRNTSLKLKTRKGSIATWTHRRKKSNVWKTCPTYFPDFHILPKIKMET